MLYLVPSNPSEEYARRVAEALEVNKGRALKHIGEPCPANCVGHLVELTDVLKRPEPTWSATGWGMLLTFRCDKGHDRIWSNEMMEIPSPISGVGVPPDLAYLHTRPQGAAVLAACIAACA